MALSSHCMPFVLLRFYKDPSSQSAWHYELPTFVIPTLQLGEVDYFAQDDKARAMTPELPCSTKKHALHQIPIPQH